MKKNFHRKSCSYFFLIEASAEKKLNKNERQTQEINEHSNF
jgi:hypothetical protein